MTESPDAPWAKSHDDRIRKPPSAEPSRAALFLYTFLRVKGVMGGRMVDIGCGNGRNAIFFAREGYEVHAVDKSDEVLRDLDLHGVMPHCHSVTDFWLFEDSFFDIAMDIFCYCYQTEADKKELYRSELKRVLKDGGIFLLSVPAACEVKEIEREFEGFEVLLSEHGSDDIGGKRIETLNVILRKR